MFQELKFNVKFDIAELVPIAPTWAYVRTNSAGTRAHTSTGKTTAEANQELFIFKKGTDGRWRIARYSFSPTNPPRGGYAESEGGVGRLMAAKVIWRSDDSAWVQSSLRLL